MNNLAAIDIDYTFFRTRVSETVRLIAPPPSLTVSQWADKYRYVSSAVSDYPGQWKTDLVPFAREIMDSVNDPRVERIVVMKAARMAMTECINNAIGYFIDYDPTTILYVQQTLDTGRDYSNSILKYLVEDTPVLASKVAERKSRDSSATIMYKTFPGGNLKITGANSPRGFRMINRRVVICDDIDGFEDSVGREGDPVDLAIHRTDTSPNRKIILISSPSVKDFSRIEREFLNTDMRYYHVPCPYCGTVQQLEFGGEDKDFGLKWVSGRPDTAFYLCVHCHGRIMNYQKHAMLLKGVWIATAPFRKAAGFHVNQLYSNFIPWSDIVADWLNSHKSPLSLQVFVNTRLGDLFEDKYEKISDNTLYARREKYGPIVPMPGVLLTAGGDIQDDRIEIAINAWGKGEESWNIDHKILHGDTSQPEVWQLLDEYLLCPYLHESGKEIWISCIALDSGYRSKQVYAFVRRRYARYVKQKVIQRIISIKGASSSGKDIISTRARKSKKYHFEVGTDTAKDTLMAYLRNETPGNGYCHFPLERDHEYFRQLTAEKKIKVYDNRGYPKAIWKKKEGARNEALDCFVYAYAALQHLIKNYNLNLDRFIDQFMAHLPAQINAAVIEKKEKTAEEKVHIPTAPARQIGRRVISAGISL